MDAKWKQIISKVAPIAATMIGGPWGGLATKAIGAVFNHQGDTPPDDAQMAEYIEKATPEQLVQLKQIDSELRLKMKELGIKEDELVFNDKADARATHKDSKMPGILSILLTIGFFGSLAAMCFVEIPEANKAIVNYMVGSLGTAWIGSMQYFHGTTLGSHTKTKLMALK